LVAGSVLNSFGRRETEETSGADKARRAGRGPSKLRVNKPRPYKYLAHQ
jgi:hypothetical protein